MLCPARAAGDLLPKQEARSQRAPREQHRALSDPEQRGVVDLLHEPRFVDLAPAQIYAMLLDEGRYLCSERTIYRILAAHREVRERRNQLRHPVYAKPHLVAKRPNELWSWDITKLLGPCKWSYFFPEDDSTTVSSRVTSMASMRSWPHKSEQV
jgi:putative transposase